ncbi:cupin domain-containing protein [Sphingobium lactosutens]|uniref:Cupin n=1 Tax=Sphingobium lactosutens DS20 TaxID=1331060 RepID=T0IT80_9SPHN|nr:cupin domain-containing protein [Sphingobium lactosutens]EQB12854.1 cupin [Sphingobium lactosutens DS20]
MSEQQLSDSGLPPVQRVVTGHDADGRARFRGEDHAPLRMVPTGDAAMLTIWSTATVPADNNDETEGRDRETGVTLNGGSVIRIVDMLPHSESPMHRTNSIDYGIVMKGAIELELEDGHKRTIEEGGVIVQRGTNHRWRNTTDTVCRIAFILIEAPAYLHNGVPLTEAKPEQVDAAYGMMESPAAQAD